MELESRAQIEGLWAYQTVGLDGVRSAIAMTRTPDGRSKEEFTRYLTPAASVPEPPNPPPNVLGLHRKFALDDIDDTVGRLQGRGGKLLGEVAQLRRDLSALLLPRSRGHHRRPWRTTRLKAQDGRGAPHERPARPPVLNGVVLGTIRPLIPGHRQRRPGVGRPLRHRARRDRSSPAFSNWAGSPGPGTGMVPLVGTRSGCRVSGRITRARMRNGRSGPVSTLDAPPWGSGDGRARRAEPAKPSRRMWGFPGVRARFGGAGLPQAGRPNARKGLWRQKRVWAAGTALIATSAGPFHVKQ